jgi:hypothetical protein
MDAKIDIYGISGDVICSVLITKDAVSHEELMTSDYIQLSWNDDKTIVLPAGAYIIYQDEKYSLIEPYLPLRENEAEYKYTPQFHSRIMIWDKIPVPLYTYESDGLTIKSREMDWDFTGSPADAMYMVKQAIKNETGENWTIQLSESLPATITISSQSTSIFSNLNNIAEECETEWWTDKKTNTIYLSECKYGTPLKLIVGENVSVPSVSESKDGYYTRFYAFGSTRNITQEYDSGQATNHIANKRLGLDPTKYPGGFKDIKGHFENGVFTSDLMPGEIFIKTLFFDKIFPSSKLTISDVRARLKYRLDNNGNKIKIGGTDDEPVYEQYAIWYFQIENFNFDKESIIDGKNLSVSFESGQLAGRDFELKYYDKPEKKNDEADVTTFEIKTGDYEIIIDESTGNIIPGLSYIIPQNGDQIILFNIIMPSEYVSSAQNELEKELDKAISDASKDNNSYEVESYPENFYEHSYDTHLGQEVNFYNGDNILNSRILMVEKHLDFQYEQTIRIGNEHIKGNTQELKEEVANVNQNIDIIKAFNELSTSLSNAYANAQREMIEGFAAIKNIWEFDNDESHWSTDNNGDKRKTIKSKYNVWSSGYISALGTNTSEDSSGTGSFDLLQDWDKYVDSTAKSMALSAFLGKDLLDRVISLEEGQKGHKITISGSGNVVVNVEESSDGGTLTFTKGNIDLSGYATKTELEAVSKKTDSVTQRVDEFLGGSDTDGIINKWKELEAFLDGQQQGTTLSSLLDKKVDKTIQVKAGEGLSGGGALSGNVTLSLATVGTAGTYTKVTVDKYGRVTGHATLSASDIPTLEISKINGLQEELDKKLNISDFGNKFATEMANWFKKDTEGNVFVANSKGFYSESFVSAMGKSSGGSGGSYERLDSWSDYTEDKATWVLSALLGSNLNTRVSALEAGGATSVVTSGTGNVVTAVTKSGNVITATKGITALTSHQNIYALTLQGNGSSIGTFNPKTGNSTINITAANIGAAASSHTHNYLPLTGGTITGELSFKPTDSSDAAPKIYSSTAEGGVTNLNFAVADDSNDSFIFRMNYYKNTNEADRERFIINWDGVTSKAAITAPSFNGNLNGNASTASKLGTSTVGGTAKPIYLNAGTATALSATVGSSSLPVYLNAGTLTQCGTSLGVSITGNSATTNQLNVSVLTSQSLADYKTSGHLYYAGGSNTVSDKPSGVDAFGMFTMQTASGWQGQILMASNTATSLYWRTANNNFNGGWRKILDSSNYGEYAYSKTDADGRFVNLSGDTMTGTLKVPELRFTNGTAIWFDQYGNVTFGSTSSSNWWYIGSSSNSPSIAVNFGTGNVGIGKTASTTYKLEVNGDVHANSFIGSLSGNASTASKWQTARTVTMNGFADCSFSIDGSSNVSFDYKPYNFYLSVNNKNNYPWHRIAKIGPITAFYQDKEVTLLLSQGYDGGKWGIVRITLRTNSTGTVSTAHVEWLNRRAFNRTDVKIGLYNASGETYADVFLWTNGAYSSVTGLVLTQGGRGTLGRTWTLVNSSEVNNTTTTDKLTSTECWTSIEVAAEELHKKAYTNIIEADDAGGVGILYDHGKLTAISGTTMPNEGLRLYRAYNNGYPAAYGNLMSVRGENSGAGELLLEWKGSTELGHIYYRSKRDNTSSGWSSWGTLAFLTDNVASATKLQTARSINGTSFDGTENITTFKWGSSRNIYIRDASQTHTGEAVSVDGSSNEYLLLPKDVAFDQITINTKLISNGQTDFNKQWLKNVGGIWFGSADSSSVFASFDGDGTQTGLQSKVGTSIYFGWRGGTRAMTIDSAGNVVIGNTSTVNSAYKLDVKGDVRTQGDIVPYSNGQYNIGSSGARWSALFTQGIELYGFTPYIDFHFNNSSADYTSRIVEVVSGCLAINGTLAVLKSGNVGIGTTLPTEKLYVSGNIAATGAVTALVLSSSSDIRLKDIRKNVCLSVEEIAKAPAVEFAWKKTGDLAVGSIAQYWQPILPQAIHKRDNYLSMQYDVIALLASIANARRILSIEKKIKELEEEVKRLKIS